MGDKAEKLCGDCGETKPLEAFGWIYRDRGKALAQPRPKTFCKPCAAARLRKWRAANRERSQLASKRARVKAQSLIQLARTHDPELERALGHQMLGDATVEPQEGPERRAWLQGIWEGWKRGVLSERSSEALEANWVMSVVAEALKCPGITKEQGELVLQRVGASLAKPQEELLEVSAAA